MDTLNSDICGFFPTKFGIRADSGSVQAGCISVTGADWRGCAHARSEV